MNLQEDEVTETKPDQVSDTDPIAPEPELYPDPANEINLQAFTQDHIQEVPVSSTPEPVPAQEHLSADKLALGELFINSPDLHPGFESQPTTPPNEAEDAPTSQSVEPPQPRLAHFYFCIPDSFSLALKCGSKVKCKAICKWNLIGKHKMVHAAAIAMPTSTFPLTSVAHSLIFCFFFFNSWIITER